MDNSLHLNYKSPSHSMRKCRFGGGIFVVIYGFLGD